MADDPQQASRRRAVIALEAAEWHAGLTLGTRDTQDFMRWRGRSADHAVAYARVHAAWEAIDRQASVSTQKPVRVRGAVLTRRRFLRATGVAAAGGAAALLAIERAAAWPRAETEIGERKLVRLGPGSHAMLNTDSAIAWKVGSRGLAVELERGEVALRLRERGITTLRVGSDRVGLSAGLFNARLRGGGCDVLVLEGAGRLADSGPHAGAQQMLRLGADRATASPIAEPDVATAWQSGEILFRDQPLAGAVAEYNRYLSRRIVVADPELAAIRVGGRFTTTDPRAFLEALHVSLGIDVKQNDRAVLLTAGSAAQGS